MTRIEGAPLAPQSSTATPPTGKEMRRVAVAAFVGTLIEFYDFLIYGTAAALVFSEVFFPALGTAEGTIASFATLGVAFVARPVGSIIFGHFGDRYGRKSTLVASLLLMGIATVLVGCLPTADSIGVLAPILLVLLRILQGMAAGGEWAGATLFATEYAPAKRRGFWSTFPSLGGGFALVLGSATFLAADRLLTDEQFLDYGWRIPFLASSILIVIGLYIRLKIDETPVFKENQAAEPRVRRIPLAEAIREQPRFLVLAAGTAILPLTLYYVAAAYLANYGTTELDYSRTFILVTTMISGAFYPAGILLGGWSSDFLGRRRVIATAAGVGVVWALLLFPMLNTDVRALYILAIVGSMFIAGVGNGPMGALMTELFDTKHRYTAAAFSYNVGGIIGGAVPPLVAAAIITTFGSIYFGILLALFCLTSFVSIIAIGETQKDEI